MQWMLNDCHELKEINGINKFNTSKVNKMGGISQKCYKFIAILAILVVQRKINFLLNFKNCFNYIQIGIQILY